MTNAEARFNNPLHPRKPKGSLGQTAQDGHLDSHTAPELYDHARTQNPQPFISFNHESGALTAELSALPIKVINR